MSIFGYGNVKCYLKVNITNNNLFALAPSSCPLMILPEPEKPISITLHRRNVKRYFHFVSTCGRRMQIFSPREREQILAIAAQFLCQIPGCKNQ